MQDELPTTEVQSLLQELFFSSVGDSVDAEVRAYLAAGLLQEDDTDFAELSDTVAGFSPGFAALPLAQQRDLIADLLQRIEQIKEQSRLKNTTAAATTTTALGAAATSAADGQAAQSGATLASVAAEALAQLGSLSVNGSVSNAGSSGPPSTSGTPTSQAQQQAIEALREVCALEGASDGFLLHVLMAEGSGSLEEAAAWLVECPDLAAAQAAWQKAQRRLQEERQREALEREQAKKSIVSRFQLQAVPNGGSGSGGVSKTRPPPLKAWGADASSANNRKARYREGAIVTSRGEKYIIEKQGEDWDGGSRGKVYTKGKRGKGFH